MMKNYFFKKYIDNNNCFENSTEKKYEGLYYMIICDLSIKKDIKNFPNLYFYSRELAFTFNLDYNDIFFELDDKIVFLILGNEKRNNNWRLGKNFIKKYPFIFDQDKKMIKLIHLDKFKDYGKDKEKNQNKKSCWNKFKVFFMIILVFIGIIIGIFIGNKILIKHRKKRANEMNDEEEDYEYISKKDIFTKINE